MKTKNFNGTVNNNLKLILFFKRIFSFWVNFFCKIGLKYKILNIKIEKREKTVLFEIL